MIHLHGSCFQLRSFQKLPTSEVYLPHRLRTSIAYYYFYICQGSHVFQLAYLPTFGSQIPSPSSSTHSTHELNCSNQNQKRRKFSKEETRPPCKRPDDFQETNDGIQAFWPHMERKVSHGSFGGIYKMWIKTDEAKWILERIQAHEQILAKS